MVSLPRIILRDHKADAVRRFHPWIFSGAIKRIEPDAQEGDWVEVYSDRGEFLAAGFFGAGSIAVKVVSFQPVESLDALFLQRFQQAYALRKQLGLAISDQTNCYRLINSEGDGLPGLIVDWYHGVAVVLTYSLGMVQQRDRIVECLKTLYGSDLRAVYDKSAAVLHAGKSQPTNQYLFGEANLGEKRLGEVLENGHRFAVDWEEGQKTGFFLDQRDNRQLVAQHVAGKKVLNTFCYSGGFSIYALQAGAAVVHSVDSSAKAIAWTEQNVSLNAATPGTHQSYAADVFNFLKDCDDDYDVIILDPPAFAKSLSARHQATLAYRRLNYLALLKIRPGGLIFTFSCSQVVSLDNFKGAVTAGAIDAGRPVRLLGHLSQPADHPTSLYHPEGQYLKGLVLEAG
ncbi:class I SAM-dependent rRNA methyltransferase [Thermoleptolyngbya sp. C42_A2020_037]|uniref:class I SAM-dependent rRNA methyltransferase n=1 Tax=Thermoleptolyngbya sp. C42_A2020_037 TaxID=2747799 RepID=UPI001A01AF8C|nr:class I SAM-dependent rRNA methyltransferase [Thermoleptolyngbya sp. C42_A2020_037]MBF2084545.1 class I SAM-dependent rRNA methyltransferase [Thermoleptolyngbya sp. C42_A2020_037]